VNADPVIARRSPLSSLGSILESLWARIVEPVVTELATIVSMFHCSALKRFPKHFLYFSQFDSSVQPIRLWWCPTGPLTSLPLHAAGVYADTGRHKPDGPKLSDFAITSYTPTLTSLIGSRKSLPDRPLKLLAVAQSEAPGFGSIHGTELELKKISEIGADFGVSVTHLSGKEAAGKRVLNEMDSCHWIHLACHGSQNQEPHKSALHLSDGPLGLLEITQKDLPDAEFAFLSACQTATGDSKLSEEAIHISAGMLLAGYRGVVGTMWSIPDDHTPDLVEDFYKRILVEDKRNPSDAAICLWETTETMKKDMKLEHWVPFIHLGI
jgi:CHAT domain-containing protein